MNHYDYIKKDLLEVREVSNNTLETITDQQSYCERKSKKCLEKGRRYYKKNIKFTKNG